MPHDIIDNRREKLLDHIQRILPSTERARFAVGYLFLSGLKPLRPHLERLREIHLLIGNTTDRETIETLAEGYKRLERLEEAAEGWRYPKRLEMQRAAEETAANVAETFALMGQTDEDEATVRTVLRLIEAGRLKVRVYTRGRLHAKAYLFDYGPIYDAQGHELPREEKGLAIVGSSNLTLAGISHNTELNVLVHGNDNHAALGQWFDELWEDDLTRQLEGSGFRIQEVKQRLAQREHTTSLTPGQRYVLRELRRLFNAAKDDDLCRDLTLLEEAFRASPTVAVRKALNLLRRNGVRGEALLQESKRIYFQHRLQDAPSRERLVADEEVPRIVCSKALV